MRVHVALLVGSLSSCSLDPRGTGSAPEDATVGSGGTTVLEGGIGGGSPGGASGSAGSSGGSAGVGGSAGAAATGGTAGMGGQSSGGAAGAAGAPTVRATDGLALLYTFQEGVGPKVNDVSAVGEPFNLTIAQTNNAVWSLDTLAITAATIVQNSTPPTKVLEACKATNELTLEAWVNPASGSQPGPARILTFAGDHSNWNFSLLQDGNHYETRLRTSQGSFSVSTNGGSAKTQLTHLVALRRSDAVLRFHLNGATGPTQNAPGDFSSWNGAWGFALANEFNSPVNDRRWLGEYHLVAVYCRGLSQAEVEQNFKAGP